VRVTWDLWPRVLRPFGTLTATRSADAGPWLPRPNRHSVSRVAFVTDAAGAEARATALLGVGSPRWRHVAGVASAAGTAVDGMGASEAELLIAVAWLHDVGYAAEVVDTGFHPLDGARYLRAAGAPERLCRLVANHSSARFEAEARGLATVLAEEFPPDRSPTADALTFADLTTDPRGARVTVEDRLDEILLRYPPGHPVHEATRRAVTDVVATVRRVEQRLATLQPR